MLRNNIILQQKNKIKNFSSCICVWVWREKERELFFFQKRKISHLPSKFFPQKLSKIYFLKNVKTNLFNYCLFKKKYFPKVPKVPKMSK